MNQLMMLFGIQGHVSPLLGVRFELADGQLELYGPDGERFLSYVGLKQRREAAEQRMEAAEQQMAQERKRAERLAARLRELGVDPEAMD